MLSVPPQTRELIGEAPPADMRDSHGEALKMQAWRG